MPKLKTFKHKKSIICRHFGWRFNVIAVVVSSRKWIICDDILIVCISVNLFNKTFLSACYEINMRVKKESMCAKPVEKLTKHRQVKVSIRKPVWQPRIKLSKRRMNYCAKLWRPSLKNKSRERN